MQSSTTHLNPIGAFTLLAVACLTIMVGCVIVPGLPEVALGLGVEGTGSWLVTLPSLGVVVFAPLAGRFITTVGARQALRFGLTAYGGLGLACIWLRGPVPVFADRILLGGATVIVMAAGTSLIAQFYEGPARLRMIASQGMAIELGGIVFLSLGGVLAGIGWQWPFLIYLFAWVCLALVEFTLPRTASAHADTAEAETVVPAHSTSMMDIYLAALASMVVFFVAVVTLPLRLQGFGRSPAEIGYVLSFVSLVAVLAAFLLPRVAKRLGHSSTLMVGFAFYAAGHVMFGSTLSLTGVVVGGVMLGVGFGLTVPLVNHVVVERSTPQLRGRNLSFLSMALFLGQFLASFVELAAVSLSISFFIAAVIASAAMIMTGVNDLRLRRMTNRNQRAMQ